VAAGVPAFVYTSTTSAFGHALQPPAGEPAAWITEDHAAIPKNMYGVTKTAAEDLCEMIHRQHGLGCVVLRTSRFFPEEDDSEAIRDGFRNDNAKANEFLYRRVDLEDVVSAHRLAMERAAAIGFGRYIVSATTPFTPEDLADLRTTRSGSSGGASPNTRGNIAAAGGGCSPVSTVFTSMRGPGGISDGRRGTTFATSFAASRPGRTRAARFHGRWDRRDTTIAPSARGPIRGTARRRINPR
jgi:hypothetical protein